MMMIGEVYGVLLEYVITILVESVVQTTFLALFCSFLQFSFFKK